MGQALVGGITSGGIYALLGLGIVIVFNVARFVNLAQGEFYVYGALLATTFVAAGVPLGLAVLFAVVIVGALGAVLQWVVFAPLSRAPHAAQLLAGVGVALAMSGGARLLWGTDERTLPPFWDVEPLRLVGVRVTIQSIVVVATLAVLCLALWWLFTRTMLGNAMQAVASNQFGARLLGIDSRIVSAIAFAIAAATGAIAGVTVAPLVFVSYQAGLLLTVYGFVAAAFGGMRSVPGAVAGGMLLGILEALTAYYGQSQLKTPIAFTILVVVLLYRSSREIAKQGQRASRLLARRRAAAAPPPLPTVAPTSWVTRLSVSPWSLVGVALVGLFAFAAPSWFSPYWISVWSFIGVFVIVGIGLDLLLGYTGQLSLGQTAFVGVSAYLVALSADRWGAPAWLAAVVAVVGTMLISVILGAIVLRLRGYYFTLATLAVSIAAEALANGLPELLGGPSGLPVRTTLSIMGFEIDTPTRLFSATWVVVAVTLLVGLRLAGSRFGQAMRAVGADEGLAAANGVPPFSVKLKAFVTSAAMAAVAGVLYAHILLFVSPPTLGFAAGFDSIVGVLLGGYGTVWGALVGIPVVRLLPETGERFVEYQLLIYGVAIVALVLLLPDGLVGGLRRLVRRVVGAGRLGARPEMAGPAAVVGGDPVEDAADDVAARRPRPAARRPPEPAPLPTPLQPALRGEDLTKSFGGIHALQGVDLAARPGHILGLIGPNGAGKSTCLAILSGSLPPDRGRVTLAGADVTAAAPEARASLGLARTFQLPRFVPGMTALETAALGAYRRGATGLLGGIAGLTGRERRAIEEVAREALHAVGIGQLADVPAARLSTGQQKLLELARALASSPSVLLTDEPAGGLFESEVARLGDLLQQLAADGLAIVLVEHEMGLVMRVCDEVVVLSFGQVIGAGRPDEVRSNEQVVDAYLGT